MPRVDNLGGGELADLVRRVRALERAAPLNNASMGRGELLVDGGTIRINGGLLAVDGVSTVAGTQTVAGTLSVTGTENVAGTLNVTGTLNANGTISLTGPTTVTGNMTVNGGGKITVAGSVPMVLGITANGRPGVEFSGGRVSSDGSRIAMESGSAAVGAASTFASVSFGASAVVVSSGGVSIQNLPTTTTAANLYMDGSGNLYRVV